MDQFWKNRPVLVTGASGFVGAHIARALLDRGAEVFCLQRHPDLPGALTHLRLTHGVAPVNQDNQGNGGNRLRVISGAIEDRPQLQLALDKYGIDSVFHLAAQSIVGIAALSPVDTFEANIRGSYNLLEACRVHGGHVRRVVIASSDKAYGAQPSLPYTEDMPLQGKFPYEVSKSCTDLITQSYFHSYNLPVAIARCGNIYGGGDLNWSRIVPATIRSFLRGESPQIRSDGRYVRDYIYVKDVTRAYLRVAECMDDPNVQGQAFNFSPERALTVLEIVSEIQRLMNYPNLAPQVLNVAHGEIFSQYLSAEKAQRVLSWRPRYSLEDGLRETIEWYREYLAI